MELRETRELERNQKESLKAEDFAISSDEEGEEAEGKALEDAKLNLGVGSQCEGESQFGIAEEEVHKDLSSLSDEELRKLVRKESPEVSVMLSDALRRLRSFSSSVAPCASALRSASPSVGGRALSSLGVDLADCSAQLALNYLLLLLNYLLLKAERRALRRHPLTAQLLRARYARRAALTRRALLDRLAKADARIADARFADRPAPRDAPPDEETPAPRGEREADWAGGDADAAEARNAQARWANRGGLTCREEEAAFARFAARPTGKPGKPGKPDQVGAVDRGNRENDASSSEAELAGSEAELAGSEADLAGSEGDLAGEDAFYREMEKRKEAKASARAERKRYAERFVNEDFTLEEGESRKATQKILKNRGLVPSRPKENRNPRVKKRRRYEQAVKRRKGQVVPMRTNEADQYMGEKSGIRADVTHSRLFN